MAFSAAARHRRFAVPLTFPAPGRYISFVAESYLIFDFGANEEAAQHARRQVEHWRHVFRLGEKLQWKIERAGPGNGGEKIWLLLRLDFSHHEKLSFQRWFERIPAEEPFKQFPHNAVGEENGKFDETKERFDALPESEAERPYERRR
ncbi:MAG TPA: hypothetical protein VIH17_07925 [Candidatus Acidoferrales bacterium]